MDVLQVTNLTKKFGKYTAVENLSFSLKEGEILGVLGRNGAGKTTLLQMCLGALLPSSGEVKYFGKDLWGNRQEILEKVNFSSTYTNLPYDLTVKECLYYSSFLYTLKNRQARIEEVVKDFELADIYKQQFTELSAGQRTRANLAKAFLNAPEILLLDEPTASLDPATSDMVRKYILKHQKERNISVLFTSHNMQEIEEVCDRVIFVDHGKILSEGTPTELAASIDDVKVSFLPQSPAKEFKELAKALKVRVTTLGNYIILNIKDDQVDQLFAEAASRNLKYKEVSIEKPDLEEYFLKHFGTL